MPPDPQPERHGERLPVSHMYVCPECRFSTLRREVAEEHAVVHCVPDSWPWEPINIMAVPDPPTDGVEAVAKALAEADMDDAGMQLYRHMAQAAITAYEAVRGERERELEAEAADRQAKLWAARHVLVAADSTLSLIFHRYRSMLPEDVQRDVDATYQDCRKAAEWLAALSSPLRDRAE